MLTCQEALFALDKDVHYFNCAYMSPLLRSVEAAGIAGMQQKRNPFLVKPDDFFTDVSRVKELFAQLINAAPAQIAVMPSVSYGMATVIKNIPRSPGKNIITVQEEFPSDVYALQKLSNEYGWPLQTISPPAGEPNRGQLWNERILDAIDDSSALVNLSSVHWADGTIFDLAAIGKRAKEVGALFVVDGTQSVGAMPIDMAALNIDALFCAAYKWLLGPYTNCLAYLGDFFSDGDPLEESWINRKDSNDFAGLVNYEAAYLPGAARYSMGQSSNFINMPMMIAALQQIIEWTPAAIQSYCDNLTAPLVQHLREQGFWLEEDSFRAKHLFGCRLPDHLQLSDVQKSLIEKKIIVSIRGNAIRISAHLYNNPGDITALSETLKS